MTHQPGVAKIAGKKKTRPLVGLNRLTLKREQLPCPFYDACVEVVQCIHMVDSGPKTPDHRLLLIEVMSIEVMS